MRPLGKPDEREADATCPTALSHLPTRVKTMQQKAEDMVRWREGQLDGSGLTFAIVCSRFNSFITERLVDGAVDVLCRHGVLTQDIAFYKVPGSWEIPLIARKLAESKRFHAIVCLGAVIRGGTPHFDYVAAEVSKGIAAVALQTGVPVAFGVLTTDSIEQAIERAGTKHGNKGAEAALSAIEMANLLRQLESTENV